MLGENIAAKPSQSVQNDNTDDTVAANQRPSVSLPYWFLTVLIGSHALWVFYTASIWPRDARYPLYISDNKTLNNWHREVKIHTHINSIITYVDTHFYHIQTYKYFKIFDCCLPILCLYMKRQQFIFTLVTPDCFPK